MLRAIGTNSGTARATTSVHALGRPQEASSSSAQSPAPDGLRASGADDWSSGSSSALSLMESAPQLVPDREKNGACAAKGAHFRHLPQELNRPIENEQVRTSLPLSAERGLARPLQARWKKAKTS